MSCIYSIIIPAYNEERYLADTLQSVLQAMDAVAVKGEVIVVDNNSTDNTAELASRYNVEVVYEAVNQISRARNTGARSATGRYLIFLDADTKLPSGLLNKAISNLDAGVCCGGGSVVSTDDEISPGYQKLLELWNTISRSFNVAAGSFIYCLREGFEKVGGFNEKVYASEEIGFSYRLKSWGKRYNLNFQVITDYPVLTSMRKARWYSPTQLMVQTIPIILFPPAVYFKNLCGPWYKRPGD